MDQTNITGLNALFTVAATGDPVLGYQWRFNGNNLTNNTHFGGAGGACSQSRIWWWVMRGIMT